MFHQLWILPHDDCISIHWPSASPLSCWVGGGFSFLYSQLARGFPLSQNGFGFLIIHRVCMPHIIHRFSPSGHPHCLAIILVTQTNVEMMMAFAVSFLLFSMRECFLAKILVYYLVLSYLTRIFGRGTAVCGKVVPARLSLFLFWFSPYCLGFPTPCTG